MLEMINFIVCTLKTTLMYTDREDWINKVYPYNEAALYCNTEQVWQANEKKQCAEIYAIRMCIICYKYKKKEYIYVYIYIHTYIKRKKTETQSKGQKERKI